METIVKGNVQEMKEPKSRPSRSNFPLHAHNLGTYRFGEYGVHLVKNGIASDQWKNRSGQEVKSYTLAQPLMTPIGLCKDYFFVPRMALLPNAWDLIYTNPVNGDDIDASIYGTSVKASTINTLFAQIKTLYNNISRYIGHFDDETTAETIYQVTSDMLRVVTLTEAIFSWGSLSASLEAPFARLFTWKINNEEKSFDDMYEYIILKIKEALEFTTIVFTDGDSYYYLQTPDANGDMPELPDPDQYEIGNKINNLRELISRYRDGELLKVILITDDTGQEADSFLKNMLKDLDTDVFYQNVSIKNIEKPFDLARLWSYQMVIAQYFSNDKVDYIYSANLMRKLVSNYITETQKEIEGNTSVATFEWNSIEIPVDWLSAYYFDYMVNYLTEITGIGDDVNNLYIYSYLMYLFSFKRSLKFMDYFTGSRTQPLAIGDTHIPVQSGSYVDVVDVSKKIQTQRYLNKVKQIGRKIEDYTKAIFGIEVKQDYHEAIYLGHTADTIGTREVENTGEAQQEKEVSVTCTFTNNGINYEFSYTPDRDGIILGIISFDIQRSYYRGFDRSYFHVNRFDFFNPYMQYTGDQPLSQEELDISQSGTFGYKNAYAEFKETYNRAWGGFITALKGWTFLDRVFDNYRNNHINVNAEHIGPEFIRARAEELDRFYLSLTGYSLANYFHFIIDNYNECDAVRPMSINPQILG